FRRIERAQMAPIRTAAGVELDFSQLALAQTVAGHQVPEDITGVRVDAELVVAHCDRMDDERVAADQKTAPAVAGRTAVGNHGGVGVEPVARIGRAETVVERSAKAE